MTFSAILRLSGLISTPWPRSFAISVDEVMRVEHDAVADDRQLAGPHDARGQQRQLVDLVADDERVAGVVAALEAHHDVGLGRQPVDDLALALVAPLGADHHHVGHPISVLLCSGVPSPGGASGEFGSLPRQKPQHLTRLTPGRTWIFAERVARGNLAVDLDERDGRAALLVAAEREGRDVDPGVAERRGEAADEARLVLVGDVDHRGREFGVDLDVLDRDDARLAVGEHRAGDRALLLVGHDRRA